MSNNVIDDRATRLGEYIVETRPPYAAPQNSLA